MVLFIILIKELIFFLLKSTDLNDTKKSMMTSNETVFTIVLFFISKISLLNKLASSLYRQDINFSLIIFIKLSSSIKLFK